MSTDAEHNDHPGRLASLALDLLAKDPGCVYGTPLRVIRTGRTARRLRVDEPTMAAAGRVLRGAETRPRGAPILTVHALADATDAALRRLAGLNRRRVEAEAAARDAELRLSAVKAQRAGERRSRGHTEADPKSMASTLAAAPGAPNV